MRWAGHLAHMGRIRMHTEFDGELQKGRNHLEDLHVG
jgi:hypothetical protein